MNRNEVYGVLASDTTFYGRHLIDKVKLLDIDILAHYPLGEDSIDTTGNTSGVEEGNITFRGDIAIFYGNNTISTTLLQELYKHGAISVWVRPYTNRNYRGALGLHTEPYSGITLQFNGHNQYFAVGNGSAWRQIIVSSEVFVRHHYMMSIEDGMLKTYTNGQFSGEISLGEVSIIDGCRNLVIGRSHRNADRYYYGEISNVRAYSEPKDEAFAKELFDEGYSYYGDRKNLFDTHYNNRVTGAASGVKVIGLYGAGSTVNRLEGKPELRTTSRHSYFYHSGYQRETGYSYMGSHNWLSNNGVDYSNLVGGAIVFENGIVGRIDGVSNGYGSREYTYFYYSAYSDMGVELD